MRDKLYQLSRMMHTGLTHFTGRGMTTIWSCFAHEPDGSPSAAPAPHSPPVLNGVDSAVIRDWARQLDDWLVEFGSQDFETDEERKVVFRQYILHRLLVLSIFHPARMGDFFSNTTPQEIHELLISARAAVRLHVSDTSIWSNWDLIMITWAAVIVLQGVAAGYGEPYGELHYADYV